MKIFDREGVYLLEVPDADLRRANLEGVNLEGANLEGANLGGANGTRFIILEGARHRMIFIPQILQLQVGCIINTLEIWGQDYKEIAQTNGYRDKDIKEFLNFVTVCKAYVE